MSELRCPACQKLLISAKAIPKHTNGCARWNEVIGVPPSQFGFDRHFQRGLWAPEMVEGANYVRCLICAANGTEIRVKRLADHLRYVHEGMQRAAYEVRFHGVFVVAGSSGTRRKETTRARYGVDNVGQSDETKEKTRQISLEKYGVSHPSQAEGAKKRRAETNLERYGAENVFASKEIQERIRGTMLERHGAENPQQVLEIRARTQTTSVARHGTPSFLQSTAWFLQLARERGERERLQREILIASGHYEICQHCDEVFTKVTSRHKAICDGWPDTEEPEPCLCEHESTSSTQMKRHRQICVVWQARDADAVMRSRCFRTMFARYGVGHSMQSEEIRARAAATNFERYGAENVFARGSSKFDKVRASLEGKSYVTWGEDNPFSKPDIREKIIRTCLAKVGKTFPDPATPAITEEDLIERYGVLYPQNDRDYASYFLYQMGESTKFGPNGLERRVAKLAPQLLYTGDRTFWRWLPKLGHHKNPDFILPGLDSAKPKKNVTKVVEAFGDFWHSRMFTGRAPFEHESELISAYADVGLECLVVWESEIKKDPEAVRLRVSDFLKGSVLD